MSSIRPLATITILVAVGVFLYLKINEKEPPLPADIAGWSMPEQVEIGDGHATTTNAGSPFGDAPVANSAPSFQATPQASTAPSFNPNLTAPPTGVQAPVGESPPATNGLPFDSPSAAATESTPNAGETTAVHSTGVPSKASDLPPLPALPSGHSHGIDTQTSTSDANTLSGLGVSAIQNPPSAGPNQSLDATARSNAMPAQTQASLFSATRLAVQAALDRGELSQALLLLSDWFGDPSLSGSESQEVNQLLSQLAGTVIYSTEHRLEPPYMVQAGERLENIAKKHNVPWQLLAKINGMTRADQLQPGQQLKVVRGPFSALIDLSERKMTLMLDRRYAGQFPINVDPATSVEEGHWAVDQKLLTPGSVGLLATAPTSPTEERTVVLTDPTGSSNQVTILRGTSTATPTVADPSGRVIHLKSSDVEEVFDILSLGSRVTIRR